MSRMHEWQWDLGADGSCRLVIDEQGAQTVYLGARIAARSTAKVDEHHVVLAPRLEASGTTDRYRQADVPARDLQLRRTRHGWIAVLEGRELFPTEWTAPVSPQRNVAPFAPPSARTFPIAATVCGVVGIAVAIAYFDPGSFLRRARERGALVNAPHESEPDTVFENESGSITIRAPSDFHLEETSATVLAIVRAELGESFAAIIVADPGTSDLDVVMRNVADRIRRNKAADPVKGDSFVLGDPVPATCHGEPGREIKSAYRTESGRSFRFWCCASLRPGVRIGEHRPPIQIFQTLVAEPVAARDEPLLRAMADATTIRDDQLPLGGLPSLSAPPARQAPVLFPQGIIGGAGHVTSVTRTP